MINPSTAPVVLELAPLPREHVGPFLLLGVEKTANTASIEEHWADRLKWARRNLINVSLEDINWAREILSDMDKRLRADIASFNLDSASRALGELFGRHGHAFAASEHSRPMDVEKDLANYSPPIEIPDLETVKASINIPEIPEETSAPREILERFVREPLDPWDLQVISE